MNRIDGILGFVVGLTNALGVDRTLRVSLYPVIALADTDKREGD
ncbi:hypothetical protein AB7C87_22015 [Natrarchaeobius sp. A-rgal3]